MATPSVNSKPITKKNTFSIIMGAAFIMATSAIGPGFLTQTAVFTEQYRASFAFVILLSIIIDIGAQMNVWRVIGISGMRGQDIANKVFPGLGYFVAGCVALGGLAFNIGNVGGAALGVNVLFGVNLKVAAVVSAVIAIIIFLSKQIGAAMDRFAKYLGVLMMGLVLFMAIRTQPPVGEAVIRTFAPETFSFMTLITLVGGTVGGYITFAGGHRLIDGGIIGEEHLSDITKGSVNGILIASIMRVLLFLAILGVVSTGFKLDPANPPASAFRQGAGIIGYKFFGVVLWSAAITSVVGAAYTSVSFLRSFSKSINDHYNYWIIAFIVLSTGIFVTVGQPVNLLILAGSLNGLILPITLGTMLLASGRKDIIGEYKHPKWLLWAGILVVIITAYAGYNSLLSIKKLF
ncbi:MAG: NRAMP family divalent metal transporter [Clostridiaceae bacterium]|nr:NRAMP family divalent metal transporter [Clostridiaceae bacterium]